jgi:hypothetical protein
MSTFVSTIDVLMCTSISTANGRFFRGEQYIPYVPSKPTVLSKCKEVRFVRRSRMTIRWQLSFLRGPAHLNASC